MVIKVTRHTFSESIRSFGIQPLEKLSGFNLPTNRDIRRRLFLHKITLFPVEKHINLQQNCMMNPK